MKARRDFLDEAGYADYLKTYTTIAAMQGLLSCDARYGGSTVNYKMLAEDAALYADAVIAEIYK